jgi:hypothetical protein
MWLKLTEEPLFIMDESDEVVSQIILQMPVKVCIIREKRNILVFLTMSTPNSSALDFGNIFRTGWPILRDKECERIISVNGP